MTLILTKQMHRSFVLMTTDMRVLEVPHEVNADGLYKPVEGAEKVISEERASKTHRISEKVLLGAGGFADLTVYLTDQLRRAVKPSADLAECREALEQITDHLREEGPEELRFLLGLDIGVTVLLAGFYHDGDTGLVTFTSGDKGTFEEERATVDNLHPANTIAPFKEYSDTEKGIFAMLPLEVDVAADDFIGKVYVHLRDHLDTIHKVLSFAHPVEISPDYVMHSLVMVDGQVEYREHYFDHSDYHQKLRQWRRHNESIQQN